VWDFPRSYGHMLDCLGVLATNFGKPDARWEKFPRRDVFIADKDGRFRQRTDSPRGRVRFDVPQ
jgi:hypothetical protein